MFGIISAWREHIRTVDELHYKALAVLLRGLDTLMFVFQKTAEGETYYVNCTPEENRESHMHTAQAILDEMDELKKMDKHVYSILRYRYEDELKECEELVKS